MKDEEKQEALIAVLKHYGFPFVMEMIDQIVARIGGEVMSVPLPPDPDKAALALYAKRMQAEGAMALRNALHNKIQTVKSNGGDRK